MGQGPGVGGSGRRRFPRHLGILEAFQHWVDQGSTMKRLPNLDFEGPY